MDFVTLVHDCAPSVAHETMAAIVRTESGFNPLAIGVNGSGAPSVRQPSNKTDAVALAKWLMANGYNIDVGLGQINSSNFARLGLSVEDAFDACANVAAAAKILVSNYQAAKAISDNDQTALRAALSAYNTGSFSRGLENGYVQRVLKNAGGAAPVMAERPTAPSAVMLTAIDEAGNSISPSVYSSGQAHGVMVY